MFGYIRPLKPELLVREYEAYKAVYCTLCRTLGKRYNVFTRLALSYDLTFYTMLALDLSGACPVVRKGHCVVNPLKSCNYVSQDHEAYQKGAALTVLMTYHKILDNIQDEKGVKSFAARMAVPFIKGAAKKAAVDFPTAAQAVEQFMAGQAMVEGKQNPSLDACCEPTAKVLSTLFKELGEADAAKARVLAQFGYFLGRWIYLMDAADDLGQDLKKGGFNPLIAHLGLKGTSLDQQARKQADIDCNQILNPNVAMLISACNLLALGKYGGIIENIVQKGLPQTQKEILFLHTKDKKQHKKRMVD